MKVKVNVHQSENRMNEVAREIMAAATDAGERGVNNFIYQFVEGERSSWPRPINSLIEEMSEGTVKCCYRGDYGSYVKYIIC